MADGDLLSVSRLFLLLISILGCLAGSFQNVVGRVSGVTIDLDKAKKGKIAVSKITMKPENKGK